MKSDEKALSDEELKSFEDEGGFCGSSELKTWWAHTNFRDFSNIFTKISAQFRQLSKPQRRYQKSGFEFLFALTS
jgi:hypothetical protein